MITKFLGEDHKMKIHTFQKFLEFIDETEPFLYFNLLFLFVEIKNICDLNNIYRNFYKISFKNFEEMLFYFISSTTVR